jgi:dihydrodipicolinate reductase
MTTDVGRRVQIVVAGAGLIGQAHVKRVLDEPDNQLSTEKSNGKTHSRRRQIVRTSSTGSHEQEYAQKPANNYRSPGH